MRHRLTSQTHNTYNADYPKVINKFRQQFSISRLGRPSQQTYVRVLAEMEIKKIARLTSKLTQNYTQKFPLVGILSAPPGIIRRVRDSRLEITAPSNTAGVENGNSPSGYATDRWRSILCAYRDMFDSLRICENTLIIQVNELMYRCIS